MNNFRIKQTFWGIGIFLLLNFISMILYPGGTIIDKDTDGYLFFYNFLSNLGEITARIRKLRKPERYKGKGVRYSGEVVKLKAGKAAGGKGAK